MPSSSLKQLRQLYLAKSMSELETHCKIGDLSSRKTQALCVSAKKILEAVNEQVLNIDEERTYVLCFKYMDLIFELRKRPDFKKNISYPFLIENLVKILKKAETLKISLLKRYSILEEVENRRENEKNGETSNNEACDDLISDPSAETISEKAVSSNKENESQVTISSEKLYSMLQDLPHRSFLIMMDVRIENDFEESHIKHSSCINVPQEILTPGIIAAKLERSLPTPSLSMWLKRGDAERIILIDWDFDSNIGLVQGSSLHTLYQAMVKWDPNCTLRQTPLILQGGYRDWMLRYPMYTTQPMKIAPLTISKLQSPITDVSGVEYPSLDDDKPTPPLHNADVNNSTSLLQDLKISENNFINGFVSSSSSESMGSRPNKSAPTVNRKSKPAIDRGLKTAESRNSYGTDLSPNSTDKNVGIMLPERTFPSVNRYVKSAVNGPSNKDASSPKSNVKKEELLSELLNKEETLANEAVNIIEQRIQKENEFQKLCMRKELEAEESKRMELQKIEDSLLEKLKQLEEESRDKDTAYNTMKDENLKLKKMLQEQQLGKEQQKQKEILETEIKKKLMLEEVERLREIRKKNEQNARNVTRREVSSATGILKRTQDPELPKQSNSTEHTVPLSKPEALNDGHSRGMVRSQSSPNIAQMVIEETDQVRHPSVDRSLKPKTISPLQNIKGKIRMRNLHPVYGNSVVRPVTGLRNLGNTCFMNSIIQCLSNTFPLAQYFNDGSYEQDLSRDSKNGTGGELTEEFAAVVEALWMAQYKSISPKDFKNVVSRHLSVCIGNEQQDSHEFLVMLMEKLHFDLNRKSVRVQLPKLDDLSDHLARRAFWEHHRKVNNSKISAVFDGFLRSTLKCMSCQTTSNSYEVFSCLSLPISSSRCSLMECLQHFLKPERMSGEAAWDCPKCKHKKDAEKRLHICRLPDVLIIQLKRFSYDGMWRRKLQTHVDFDFSFQMPYQENGEDCRRKYSLYGVVNHHGTLEGGHYIACCRNSGIPKWFKYDDHEVSEINPTDIRTSAAYLLFYTAVDFHSYSL